MIKNRIPNKKRSTAKLTSSTSHNLDNLNRLQNLSSTIRINKLLVNNKETEEKGLDKEVITVTIKKTPQTSPGDNKLITKEKIKHKLPYKTNPNSSKYPKIRTKILK
jgi:hypothetical protein